MTTVLGNKTTTIYSLSIAGLFFTWIIFTTPHKTGTNYFRCGEWQKGAIFWNFSQEKYWKKNEKAEHFHSWA